MKPGSGYRAANVSAEWLPEGTSLPCYHDTRHWNGWGMPQFTLDEGLQLMKLMPSLRYDHGSDAFIHMSNEPGEEPLVVEGRTIDVDGASLRVYPIGAGYWCWDYPT